MRNGSAIANGVRQYAAPVTTTWQQLESGINGFAVGDDGLALGLPVLRWKGQTGTSSTGNQNPYDYVQGLCIENLDASATLYVTTTKDADGSDPSVGTARSTAYAIKVAPGAMLRLDNTDATKVWLAASSALTAAILAT
jgi:hypothetical protein